MRAKRAFTRQPERAFVGQIAAVLVINGARYAYRPVTIAPAATLPTFVVAA